MTAPDYRISRGDVDGAGPDDLFWAITEPLWPRYEGDDDVAVARQGTPGMRAVMATTLFLRDVDNGGLEQALRDQDPAMVSMAQEGLWLLGADEQARALDEAIRQLLGLEPPADEAERPRLMETRVRGWPSDGMASLNERTGGEQRLWPLYQAYIDRHPHEFFRD